MGDYLSAATPLLTELPRDTVILGAHRDDAPGLPTLSYADLRDLEQALQVLHDKALDGEGTWPVNYPINENISLMAEPRLLQRW